MLLSGGQDTARPSGVEPGLGVNAGDAFQDWEQRWQNPGSNIYK